MTREEAVEYWQEFDREIDDMLDKIVSDEEYELLIKQREAVEFTLAALRAQQEQKNEMVPKQDMEIIIHEVAKRSKPKWISVKDRLPVRGERVLATDGNFVGEAYRTGVSCWHRHGGFQWKEIFLTDVTHWMPLPDPPVGEPK